MKNFYALLLLLLLPFNFIHSQTDSAARRFVRVIPGKEYEAGWLHELFFGSHWRDVWTTPVKVEIIDLGSFAGGLTPLKKGGGLQTKSLRLKGADGKEYKFRSLNKDPKKVLPLELQESIAADIIQDQISSSNPYAGFVVNYILKEAGVYHSDYKLAILPDDEKLGLFRKEFGGIIGLIEIVPDEETFEGTDKVIGTVKLLDRLGKEFDESVDSKEFLKARLLDIFFGDWDRHKGQWKWIRTTEENGIKVYKPYPMDRDQAFAEFDGLFPMIAEANVPQLNHFGDSYPDMKYMTWNGKYVDQRFLTFLSRNEWDEVTRTVKSKLSDKVIEEAVKQLPPEVYKKAKNELVEKLKSRRDDLTEASSEFYELVNEMVDIYTSDKRDYVEIDYSRNSTKLSVYKRNKETGEKEGEALRSKIFSNDITDELRIYLEDGDDRVVVSGSGDGAPKTRIIGGRGKDEVISRSDASVIMYDDGKKTIIKDDSRVCWKRDKYSYPYEKTEKYYNKNKDRISEKKKDELKEQIGELRYSSATPPDKFGIDFYKPLFYYTPDIGPLFGLTATYYKYGFRMDPYLYKIRMTIGYAPMKYGITGLQAVIGGEFNGLVKNSTFGILLRKSGIQVNNYFGQGNETPYSDSLSKNKYYAVEQEELVFNPYIIFPRDKMARLTFGGLIKNSRQKGKDNTLLSITKPYGSESMTLLEINAGFEVDGRDNQTAPYLGYYLNLSGAYFPKVFNNSNAFGRLVGDVRGYLGYKTNISLALKLRGEKVWGTYPFFESSYLGGFRSLRGFSSERFAGDGALLGGAELRLKLFDMLVLFPETVGLYLFGESGRVFLKNEESKKWHAGYGAGLFMHFINRDITFNLAVARSSEKDYSLYFSTGFSY